MQEEAPTGRGRPPSESAVSHKLPWAALLALVCMLAAPPPVRAAEGSTKDSATMVSEGGDYIGGGTDRLFDAPGSVLVSGGLSHVAVSASGEAGSFSFDFAPPSGGQLEVGEYAGAQHYPFEPTGSPGLSVSGEGRECNKDYGRFIVKDIHVDESGNVDRFWALYEQHCGSPHAPALFGELRVGEPPTGAPEAVEPSAIDWPVTWVGSSGVDVPVTVIAGESGATVTAIGVEGEDAGDFSVSSDGCSGTVLSAGARCQLHVAVKPTAPGARMAQLVITDNSGAKTTVALAVHAEPLLKKDSATMVSEGGDYIGGGTDRLFDALGSVFVSGGLSHVAVSASGEAGSFSFDFAPPSGGQLEVGEYAGAQHYPFEPTGSPGLSVRGDGRECSKDYGRFIVKDIHVDESGNVDRFWALYEQHCESPHAPALFGELRVGEPPTAAPEAVEPTAIGWPITSVGSSGVDVPVTVIAGESGAQVTAIGVEGEDAGDFSVSSDGCSGTVLSAGARCQLEVAVKPTAPGARIAQLVITDNSGAKTTVALTVFAEPAGPPPIEPPPNPPPMPPTQPPSLPVTNPPTTPVGPLPGVSTHRPPHLQITPTKPRTGKPDVYVELGVVREVLSSSATHAVLGYRYLFSAQRIRCINGATNILFTIMGRRHTAPCRASLILISGPVTPQHTYTIRVQAVKIRSHKVLTRGASHSGRLYMPGSEARWTPLAQLPPAV